MRFLNRLQQHQRTLAMIPGKPKSILGYVGSSIFGFKAIDDQHLELMAEDAITTGLYISGGGSNKSHWQCIMANSVWFHDKVDLDKSSGRFKWKKGFAFVAFQNVTVSDSLIAEFFIDLKELVQAECCVRLAKQIAAMTTAE